MHPTFDLPSRVAAAYQPDWPGIRHALLRSTYACLLVLVMLLPANFVAYALSSTLFHGGAFTGMQFATTHHVSGFWLGTSSVATPVTAPIWWAAAIWEVLFWASCASALTVFILWTVRAVAGQITLHTRRPTHSLDNPRAA